MVSGGAAMSLRTRLVNVERSLARSYPRQIVVVHDDDILGEHPEYHEFKRRIAELDRLRCESDLFQSEQYRQAELALMEEYDRWSDEIMGRECSDIRRIRWHEDDVLLVRHSYSEARK